MSATARPDLSQVRVEAGEDHLELTAAGSASWFHYVWLRDNCGCPRCGVPQPGERPLFPAAIPDDIAPTRTSVTEGPDGPRLEIAWNDDHTTTYAVAWLLDHAYSGAGSGAASDRRHEPVLWDAT